MKYDIVQSRSGDYMGPLMQWFAWNFYQKCVVKHQFLKF